MATYTGQQRFLLQAAQKYSELGYSVGLAKGKAFLQTYEPDSVVMTMWGPFKTQKEHPDNFNGISLIPKGIVCVDIDIPDFGVVYEALPPTLKERTPRGWHLWYLLPIAEMVHGREYQPKIKWRPHVDLLTKGKPTPNKKASKYRSTTGGPDHWGEHILVSPTTGYQRIWPDDMPQQNKLTVAPTWLVDALEK